MSLYVVAYDITHNGRRRRVSRILQGYGHRVQRSVFEVWLDPQELAELRRRVGPLLSPDDEFDFFPVDERGKRTRVSWQRPPDAWRTVLLVG